MHVYELMVYYSFNVYNRHENRIHEVWTEIDSQLHKENLDSIRDRNIELVRYKVDNRVREHLEGVMKIEERGDRLIGTVEKVIGYNQDIGNIPRIRDRYGEIRTEDYKVKDEEVGAILGKLKGKKATGLDRIKPEMY